MRLVRHNSLSTRLSSIIEEKLHSDPSVLQRLNAQEKAAFEARFLDQINYLKLENLLKHSKHDRLNATATPWTGTESAKDSSLRMLLDARPKPKKATSSGKRILSARESSMEYKETKTLPEDNFRELYKERLLGPSMLVNPNSASTVLNMPNSMASAKINQKIDLTTGKFNDANMEQVRGKPLSKEHLANATDTNYFVNQLLNKQEVLPPWIETQQSLNSEITNFRNTIDTLLVVHCRNHGIPEKDVLHRRFKGIQSAYVTEKLKLINAGIRDYNLQSPSSNFHKLKLQPEEELQACVERCYDRLGELVEASLHLQEEKVVYSTKQGFLSLFEEQKAVSQRPVEPVNVWRSFKQMFLEIRLSD